MTSNDSQQLSNEQSLNRSMVRRALNRRNFLSTLAAGAAVAGAGVFAGCGDNAQVTMAAGVSETDVLNFALNLEYLEATFYSLLATGQDLSSSLTGGGPAPTGLPSTPPVLTGLTADVIAAIYYDEMSHVADLRSALGSAAVARPQLNMAALGQINQSNYLAAARLFEDVGVTAYAGAATLLTANNLQAAAQILAVEGFHAGALRLLCIQGGQTQALTKDPNSLDITPADPGAAAEKAGPTQAGSIFAVAGPNTTKQTNTFPGLAYQRTTSQVLQIVYAATSGSSGGFYPSGMNGNIKSI